MRHLIHLLTNTFIALIKKTRFGKTVNQDYAGIPLDKLRRLAKQNENRWLRLPNGTFLRYVSRSEVLVRHMDGSIFQLDYEHPSRITSRLVNPTAEQLILASNLSNKYQSTKYHATHYQSIGTKISISPERDFTSNLSS
jgi:hypothetical protein